MPAKGLFCALVLPRQGRAGIAAACSVRGARGVVGTTGRGVRVGRRHCPGSDWPRGSGYGAGGYGCGTWSQVGGCRARRALIIGRRKPGCRLATLARRPAAVRWGGGIVFAAAAVGRRNAEYYQRDRQSFHAPLLYTLKCGRKLTKVRHRVKRKRVGRTRILLGAPFDKWQ